MKSIEVIGDVGAAEKVLLVRYLQSKGARWVTGFGDENSPARYILFAEIDDGDDPLGYRLLAQGYLDALRAAVAADPGKEITAMIHAQRP